jgi:hypothetical protein
MELVAEYRRRAAEVERLAESAISEEHRRLILELARTWRTMADQREMATQGPLERKTAVPMSLTPKTKATLWFAGLRRRLLDHG